MLSLYLVIEKTIIFGQVIHKLASDISLSGISFTKFDKRSQIRTLVHCVGKNIDSSNDRLFFERRQNIDNLLKHWKIFVDEFYVDHFGKSWEKLWRVVAQIDGDTVGIFVNSRFHVFEEEVNGLKVWDRIWN